MRTPSAIGGTVGYQLHSYNDLREWPQLLAKGGVSFKVDPQWVPQVFCALQPRANGSDPRGCLLLNHDTVTPTNWYWTLDDLLTTVTSAPLVSYFQGATRRYIALCFKGNGGTAGACDGSPSANDWLSLVDGFVSAANAAIAGGGLNLEFVLDGDADPGGGECLTQRWRPWVATYISGQDAAAGFTSNNTTLGYDRYQVLNEPVSAWPPAVAAGYGKFVNATYPYQCWEPSDQPTTLTMSDDYVNAGQLHAPGFRFAINTDSVQFETYVGALTGRAWNYGLTAPAAGANNGTLPLWVPLPTGGGGALCSLLLMTTAAGGSVPFVVHSYAGARLPPTVVASATLSQPSPPSGCPPGATLTAVAASAGNTSSTVAIAWLATGCGTANGGALVVVPYTVTPAGLLALAGAVSPPLWLPSWVSAPAALGVGLDATAASPLLVVGALPPSPATAGCSAYVGIGDVASGTWRANLTCAAFNASEPLTTIAVSVSAGEPAVVGAAAMSGGGYVYGASFCAASASPASLVFNDPALCAASRTTAAADASAPPPLLRSFVGAAPRLAVARAPATGTPVVVEVHGAGYCQNAESFNKDAWVKLCDQVPVPTGGAYLNYNLGTLSNWTAQLTGGGWASPCSTTVFQGMFDMGYNPAPAWYVAGSGSGLELGVAAVGTLATDTDPATCGIATPAPGTIKLDGWELPPDVALL